MKTVVSALAAAAALAALRPGAAPAPKGGHAFDVDPVHSSVVFKVKHFGLAWFYGTLAVRGGSFTLDPGSADAGIEVTIDAASVATRDPKRDEAVRGPDYFDVKQFPTITFAGKKVRKDGDALAIDGELTMHGRTRPLSVTVQKTGEGEFMGRRVGYETTFTVKRSDFGMENGLAKKALGDEVTLTVSLEATAAAGSK